MHFFESCKHGSFEAKLQRSLECTLQQGDNGVADTRMKTHHYRVEQFETEAKSGSVLSNWLDPLWVFAITANVT